MDQNFRAKLQKSILETWDDFKLKSEVICAVIFVETRYLLWYLAYVRVGSQKSAYELGAESKTDVWIRSQAVLNLSDYLMGLNPAIFFCVGLNSPTDFFFFFFRFDGTRFTSNLSPEGTQFTHEKGFRDPTHLFLISAHNWVDSYWGNFMTLNVLISAWIIIIHAGRINL